MSLKIFSTPEEIAETVSYQLLAGVKEKAEIDGKFYLAVSGGSTPKILFNRLSQSPFNNELMWNFLHIFWVDERCVPPDNEESNYGITKKILLDMVNIPSENIHRIRGEENPAIEIFRYAVEIKQYVTYKNNMPSFDWILLGMGSDGHTASLFPDSALFEIADGVCGTAVHPVSKQKRISLTEGAINNAEKITFLVTGKDKSDILNKVLKKEPSSKKYPAAKINPVFGNLEWLIDKEAGGSQKSKVKGQK